MPGNWAVPWYLPPAVVPPCGSSKLDRIVSALPMMVNTEKMMSWHYFPKFSGGTHHKLHSGKKRNPDGTEKMIDTRGARNRRRRNLAIIGGKNARHPMAVIIFH